MPITKTVKGDLVKMAKRGEFDIIIHGCNCHGVMGAGIAPQIANAFEGVRKADKEFRIPLSSKERLGDYSYVEVDNLVVINAYTQYNHNRVLRQVNYDAIYSVFASLNATLGIRQDFSERTLKIGIPKIGAGLGGGNWKIIETIINEVTPSLEITLVDFKKEGGMRCLQ